MPVEQLVLPDGRLLDYCLTGEDSQPLLVFHLGSPSGVTDFPMFAEAAAAAGLRLVLFSRPGYGGSTRRPGHLVSDAAADTALLADHLGAKSFLVIGWSGGGPAALACAALLPERVRACATVAGVAPVGEAGDDWDDWYSPDDHAEIELLRAGEVAALTPIFEGAAEQLAGITASALVDGPGTATADRLAFVADPRGADSLSRSLRLGLAAGWGGWFDDGLAHAGDWGFSVRDITVPVIVRHGDDDHNVSVAQGRWLAQHIPGAVLDEVAGGGHGSVAMPLAPVLTALLAAAD